MEKPLGAAERKGFASQIHSIWMAQASLVQLWPLGLIV